MDINTVKEKSIDDHENFNKNNGYDKDECTSA